MAVVVESTTVNTFSAVTTVTLTKPTGLAVDDLMVAAICFTDDIAVATITTPAGWTLVDTTGELGIDAFRHSTYYKLADSGDVAASNFSFVAATGNPNAGAGVLLRVSGVRTDTQLDSSEIEVQNNVTDPQFTLALTAGQDNVLYVIALASKDNGATNIASPTIDGTNPTWVEHLDDVATDEGDNVSFYVASAVVTTTGAITTLDTTPTGTGTSTDWGLVFSIYGGINDVTGTMEFIAEEDEVFDVSGRAGVHGTVDFIAEEDEVFDIAGNIEQPTRWTQETKDTTTWSNETKS